MTAVFVHGNPDTAAVWGPLLVELGREDVVCLSPPGFGAPLPDGFTATVGEYRAWLIEELEALGAPDEPVDLVGHDWGGGHVLGVAMTRPDLLRSWVSDTVGLYDPDYVWHPFAQEWQTPGKGERAMAELFTDADLETRTASLVGLGFPSEVAGAVAAEQNAAMGRAMLALYRSAVQPVMADTGRDLERAATRPGLAVMAAEDHMVGTDEQQRRAAATADAHVEVLDGLGHWWMLQDPTRSAGMLCTFWDSITDEAH